MSDRNGLFLRFKSGNTVLCWLHWSLLTPDWYQQHPAAHNETECVKAAGPSQHHASLFLRHLYVIAFNIRKLNYRQEGFLSLSLPGMSFMSFLVFLTAFSVFVCRSCRFGCPHVAMLFTNSQLITQSIIWLGRLQTLQRLHLVRWLCSNNADAGNYVQCSVLVGSKGSMSTHPVRIIFSKYESSDKRPIYVRNRAGHVSNTCHMKRPSCWNSFISTFGLQKWDSLYHTTQTDHIFTTGSGETRENKNEQTLMNLNEKNQTGNNNKNTEWLIHGLFRGYVYIYTKQSTVVKKEWDMYSTPFTYLKLSHVVVLLLPDYI